jgi:hypothetical protein
MHAMNPFLRLSRTRAMPLAWAAAVLALVQGCSTAPGPAGSQAPTAPQPTHARPGEPLGSPHSSARTAKEYRRDAAQHLYARQAPHIYKGRLPPMLYAVGVLNVEIDRRGQVLGLHWTRAPKHAPEVMAEIEKMVRASAPYPAPTVLGRVTYTDVWLWHKSGQFQLDTLTEGQD